MKTFSLYFIILLFIFSCTEKKTRKSIDINKTPHQGAYIDDTLPKDSALLFAKNFISTGMNERDAAFSPGMKEFYYTIQITRNFVAIVYSKKIDGNWSQPEIASFSGKYKDLEPVFHPNGKKLFFVSNRPAEEGQEINDFDIWYVDRNEGQWSEPKNIGKPVNTDNNEFYPSFTNDGTLYFCTKSENSIGGEDLFYSSIVNDKFTEPKNMGDSINSKYDEYNAHISPDGSFIIYTTHGWGKGYGSGDLYIAFKDQNGQWRSPVNMGHKINSPYFEYCPSLSPDGKYLFFTSHRLNTAIQYQEMTYNGLQKIYNSPGNGNGDLYWISTEIFKN